MTRAALAAFLLAVPLFATGARPSMAQAMIVTDGLESRAGAQVVNPASEAALLPSDPPPTSGQSSPDASTSPSVAAEGSDAAPSEPDGAVSAATPVGAPTSYVVQAKDTLFSIARRHSVSVDALLWANSLADANVLKEGQKLTIPPSSGTLYTAKDGDTLDAVAKANGVSTTGIAAVNGLAEDASLAGGQRLLIPAPRQAGAVEPASVSVSAAQVSAPVPVPSPSATPTPATTLTSLVSSSAPLVKPTESPPASPSASPSPSPTGTPSVTVTTRKLPKLEWPIPLQPPKVGVTQRFQPGHTGIDIGAPEGTPIKAMAAGVVKRAEKGDNGGYGTLVVLDHGDGVTTWYAHLSQMSVSVGDQVQVGEQVGLAGSTGRSTGPHLHFELRVGNTPIDPLVALPK